MDLYGPGNIRNVVMLSHSGAGKTTLAEVMLAKTGAISRIGKVEEGNTTSDYEPEEARRKISLNLSLLPLEWQKNKINLLDTPGYADFVGEVISAIKVSESALITICAASGVEVGTEQVWSYAENAKLPRIIFINKMDRENANFETVYSQIQEKFGTQCVPLQVPVGAHTTFQGIIDLLQQKAYLGEESKEAEIPAEMNDQVASYREKLIEAVAEIDDKLIEKYLGGEELSEEEISNGLCQGVAEGKIIPVLTGSALTQIGIGFLLDALNKYMPSPENIEVALENDTTIKTSAEGTTAALVFKTSADPYVGKLTYFRVYSGSVDSNSQLWNANSEAMERLGQLFTLRGKTQEAVAKIPAGDIGAVAKLAQTNTGNTLCTRDSAVKISSPVFPNPIFNGAVSPKTKTDVDKMGTALARLAEEDPTLQVHRDSSTGDTILSGLGETHLEVSLEKLQRKFGVGLQLGTPKIPYKETIRISAKAQHKHKKQSGGHGQYGHVMLEVEPLPRGTGIEFADKIVGGSIPRNFIPAVEKGVMEGIQKGVLAEYPVVDVRATAYDGSFHPVDSSEICFKIAGSQALKKGLAEAQPIILEPIVKLNVTVPDEYTGDIIGDLNSKRARVQGMIPGNGKNSIEAEAPLAEVQRYSIDLKSITQGRGSFTMEFSHYEEVPQQVTQKIVADHNAAKEA